MKIAFSRYALKRADHSGERNGALLQITFPDGIYGYADLHPWPELGDASLSSQLAILSQKTQELTPLLLKSIAFARVDAEARADKVSLFDGVPIPPSHYLVPDILHWSFFDLEKAYLQGFRYFKLKMGNHFDQEKEKLVTLLKESVGMEVRFRLDFNFKLQRGEFEEFLEMISPSLSLIDFIEDPFAYDPIFWQSIQEKYAVNLAADRHVLRAMEDGFQSAKVLIFKPAIDQEKDVFDAVTEQAFVFTSYLDHPFGQMCAARVAAEMMRQQPQRMKTCGLMSHQVYEDNEFSQALSAKGPFLRPPQGTGFGFDDILEKLSWQVFP